MTRFFELLLDAITKIEDRSHPFTCWREDVYWLKLGRFPYVIYFRQINSSLRIIMAVALKNRREGYWLRRKVILDD